MKIQQMPQTFEEAFGIVKGLVDVFKENEQYFTSAGYQEAECREDHINKLFWALGWDVRHDFQKNPYQQEVKVERNVDVKGAQKRADYAFYVAPNFRVGDVRLYVEAKKPFGNIITPDNCFQVHRYAYGSQNPIAILTSFNQFVILDCRPTPDIDYATSYCVEEFHYTDFADKEEFAKIYYLFGRAAVAGGSIEAYVANLPKRRAKVRQRGLFKGGYKPVDVSFLEVLDEARRNLARSFKRENPELDGPKITEITQRTLDRLVFMRFLEDKLIEPNEFVSSFGMAESAWADFLRHSRRLDKIYNGIVFKKHGVLDSPDFVADDNTFTDVCETLSSANSPYNFNTIPIHILGSIYERFLGSEIVVKGKTAEVELKPELQNAEGAFYTPEFIVRYIVEKTLDPLVAGKNPETIEDMTFADIACGSGSFLLGVYDYLLRYHANYYNQYPKQASKEDTIEKEDGLHLSLKKKRQILLNNVFGVDIDSQAVEVAQLSLFLKLLEEETTASARHHQLEFHETLLPSLANNIVCGNSLVETDLSMFRDGERERKINAMDFKDRFPEIFNNDGGFDAIVGNPPYIRIQVMQEWMPETVPYYSRKYPSSAGEGNYDIYVVFVERGLSLLSARGRLGYIMPQKFWHVQYGANLRRVLAQGENVSCVVNFRNNQVFESAFVNTCLLFLARRPAKAFEVVDIPKVTSGSLAGALKSAEASELPASVLNGDTWVIRRSPVTKLLKKLAVAGKPLEEVTTRIFQGYKTSGDKIFVLELREESERLYTGFSIELGQEVKLEKSLCHKLVKGTEMRPFVSLPAERIVVVPYDKAELLSITEISKRAPRVFEYLKRNEKALRVGGQAKRTT